MSNELATQPEAANEVALHGEYPVAASPVHHVTPTQAKADAVSKLLGKSVERASELRLTPEESKALKAEFADECFLKGAAGKEKLLYLEHMHLRNRFDEALGMGQWAIVMLNRWAEEKGNATTVYFEGALIVRGCYVTQAIGDMVYYPNNASQNFGDATEGAESACLRRCAKKFGVGLQAWSKTWCEGWWTRQGKPKPPEPTKESEPTKSRIPATWFDGIKTKTTSEEIKAYAAKFGSAYKWTDAELSEFHASCEEHFETISSNAGEVPHGDAFEGDGK